jgi:hypothetical protein
MGDARPPVRWGPDVDMSGTIYAEYSQPDVFPPKTSHVVPFEHVGADGHYINPVASGTIVKRVNTDDVVITFTDTSGLRWRRTGNGEPVRVIPPDPGAE